MTWLINFLTRKLVTLPGIVLGLSIHEFGHAKVAQLCGDDTAQRMGRVSLNPLDHFDLAGAVCLFVFGFGWGKPVIINPRNFKNPRRDTIFVGIAGVFLNFVTAIVLAFIVRIIFQLFPDFFFTSTVGGVTRSVLVTSVITNLSLMLFNLIPCPPLDGFGVLAALLNLKERHFKAYAWLVTYGSKILFIVIIIGVRSGILDTPLTIVYNWVMDLALIGL